MIDAHLPEQTWFETLTNNAPAVYEQQFRYVKDLFVYVDQPNEAKEDTFKVHQLALLLNDKFEGDCDDFATTMADWLMTQGMTKVQIILVGNPYQSYIGHVVVLIPDRNGNTWVMDNQENYVMPWNHFVKKLRKKVWYILSLIHI